MQEMVTEIRKIITAEGEVDPNSVLVFFRALTSSSLDIWVAYNVRNPDFAKSMELRQRINLAIMREVMACLDTHYFAMRRSRRLREPPGCFGTPNGSRR